MRPEFLCGPSRIEDGEAAVMNKWLALVIMLGLAGCTGAATDAGKSGYTPYSPVNSVLHGGG